MNGTLLVIRDYEGDAVFFQPDASLNATEIAKRFGKRTENWLRSDRTQVYRDAVARRMGVTPKSVTEENQLVVIRQGGNPGEQGTWIHPKLALDFARWLNADFAVWCDEQIESLLHGEPLTVQPLVTTLDAVVGIVAVRRHQQTEIDTLKDGQRRQGLAIDQLTPLLKRCPPRPVRINDRQLAMDLTALPPPLSPVDRRVVPLPGRARIPAGHTGDGWPMAGRCRCGLPP